MKMKAETRAMHVQAKEPQSLPANPRQLGERLGQILLASEGARSAPPLISDFCLQSQETVNVCSLNQGSPTPEPRTDTGPRPVGNQATQQAVRSR